MEEGFATLYGRGMGTYLGQQNMNQEELKARDMFSQFQRDVSPS